MNAMSETLKRVIGRRAAAAVALTCVFGLGVPANAASDRYFPDVKSADAVLYEVSENMYLLDAAGNVVGPEAAVRRKADASLYGWARVGNPLCPTEVLTTNPRAHTCSVTAAGVDDLALDTFSGGVGGTFAVVLQDDNDADSPEFVIMNGAFKGAMDLSPVPRPPPECLQAAARQDLRYVRGGRLVPGVAVLRDVPAPVFRDQGPAWASDSQRARVLPRGRLHDADPGEAARALARDGHRSAGAQLQR